MPIKIYIAGKITGLPYDEYAPKFAAAAETIREMGHIPLNPVVLTGHLPGGSEWEDYIIIGLEAILRAGDDSALYMLYDWKDSRGATIEHDLAISLGRDIIYEVKDGEIRHTVWTTKDTRDMFTDKRIPKFDPIYLLPTGKVDDGRFELPASLSEVLAGVKKLNEDGSIQQP